MTQNRLLIAIFSASRILSGWFVIQGISQNKIFSSSNESELTPVNQSEASTSAGISKQTLAKVTRVIEGTRLRLQSTES